MNTLMDMLASLGNIDATTDLLRRGFVKNALVATSLLALLAGLLGPLLVHRRMAFAVHGTSELALTGAAAALLFGFSVGNGAILGSVVAAVLFGLLGTSAAQRDSSIGVVMAFGLGLAVLFLHLYPGRSSTAMSLLTGQVASISGDAVVRMLVVTVLVAVVFLGVRRPLIFLSADPLVAQARGVPIRLLSIIFAVLIGVTAAQGVQIVGALLVMALIITPAATAVKLSHSPLVVTVLAIVIAQVSALGGIVLSLAPGLPMSVMVSLIAFALYAVASVYSALRGRATARV